MHNIIIIMNVAIPTSLHCIPFMAMTDENRAMTAPTMMAVSPEQILPDGSTHSEQSGLQKLLSLRIP